MVPIPVSKVNVLIIWMNSFKPKSRSRLMATVYVYTYNDKPCYVCGRDSFLFADFSTELSVLRRSCLIESWLASIQKLDKNLTKVCSYQNEKHACMQWQECTCMHTSMQSLTLITNNPFRDINLINSFPSLKWYVLTSILRRAWIEKRYSMNVSTSYRDLNVSIHETFFI